jgi:hypothetical protein
LVLPLSSHHALEAGTKPSSLSPQSHPSLICCRTSVQHLPLSGFNGPRPGKHMLLTIEGGHSIEDKYIILLPRETWVNSGPCTAYKIF